MNRVGVGRTHRAAMFLLAALAALSVAGCVRREVTLVDARQIANQRFAAHAHARGLAMDTLPEPSVEVHASDYVFEYRTGDLAVTVIVARNGPVADRAVWRGRAS